MYKRDHIQAAAERNPGKSPIRSLDAQSAEKISIFGRGEKLSEAV
jgi:hypothetical protein